MQIIFCADIHISPNSRSSELLGCFENMLTSCDMLVIGGDILDAKFYASSEAIKILMDIMEYITPLCKATNKIVRLIYGTLSHDGYPQLQILTPYTRQMNFKIIQHVQEETIKGTSFLYIPEEIISDKHEYYANTLYSGKQYDYIFGHGVIAEGMPMVKPSTKKVKSVPIFKTEELRSACKYHVLFGHYHRNIEFGNVAYVGSLTRFTHGEPEPKGWYHLDGKRRTFIQNPWCPTFIEHKIDALKYNVDDFQSLLLNYVKEFQSECGEQDKLKFTVFMDRKNENALTYLDILRSISKHPNVSYAVKDINDVRSQEETLEEEFDYIMDPNVSIRDKILRYNETEFEGEIDSKLLDTYLQKIKPQDS